MTHGNFSKMIDCGLSELMLADSSRFGNQPRLAKGRSINNGRIVGFRSANARLFAERL
jgi:hypothetical protein